jgi:hypothetical protein
MRATFFFSPRVLTAELLAQVTPLPRFFRLCRAFAFEAYLYYKRSELKETTTNGVIGERVSPEE